MEKLFAFLGYHKRYDGYGYATIKTAEALRRIALGEPSVAIVDTSTPPGQSTPRQHVAGTAVALLPPPWFSRITADCLVGYTMFEATRLPGEYVRTINNRTLAVVVPTPWNAEIFRESGVTRPIYVVPFGVDSAEYAPLERPRTGEPYTFSWWGTTDLRKGWNVVYKAFRAAFGDCQDVRLRLHFRTRPEGFGFRDANVITTFGPLEHDDVLRFYQEADCFVFPSRGEGWGLPPREAAATGLPVIATDYGGLAYELPQWGIPLQVAGMKPAAFGIWEEGQVGHWPEPDTDQLIELMRQAASNPAEMARRGIQAACWLRDNTPWERTARGLMAVAALEGAHANQTRSQ